MQLMKINVLSIIVMKIMIVIMIMLLWLNPPLVDCKRIQRTTYQWLCVHSWLGHHCFKCVQ